MKLIFFLVISIITASVAYGADSRQCGIILARPHIKAEVHKVLVRGAVPRGGQKAGKFHQIKLSGHVTAMKCARLCCQMPAEECSAIYFINKKCWLVKCKSSEECEPMHVSRGTYRHAVTALLRDVVTTHEDVLGEPCNPNLENCPTGQTCQSLHTTGRYHCACREGTVFDKSGKKCVPVGQNVRHTSKQKQERACIVGVHHACWPGEVCQPTTDVSRSGVCRPAKANTTLSPSNERPCVARSTTRTCDMDEICVATYSGAQEGVCKCRPGRVKDANGACIYEDLVIKKKSTPSTIQETTKPTKLTKPETVVLTTEVSAKVTKSKKVVALTTQQPIHTVEKVTQKAPTKAPSQNTPPVVHVGGKRNISASEVIVQLDGSTSSDDKGIVQWAWTRSPNSPAAGMVQNNSDTKPVLVLTGLVSGVYHFTLTVKDSEGLTDVQQVTINVIQDKPRSNLLELRLKTEYSKFTVQDQTHLVNGLNVMIERVFPDKHAKAVIDQILEDTSNGNLMVVFHVVDKKKRFLLGLDVAHGLRPRLTSAKDVLDYAVVQFDTLLCQVDCSGRGICHPRTKQCICNTFWAINTWRAWKEGESNCDWNIPVVVVVFVLLLFALICFIYAAIRCRRRCCPRRRGRTVKYCPINDLDDSEYGISLPSNGGDKKRGNAARRELLDPSSDEENVLYSGGNKGTGSKNT